MRFVILESGRGVWVRQVQLPELTAELLARCTFPVEGTKVTCAVSGGADSLALLVLAVEAGCSVTAAHVDHGLREGSASEADIVRVAAERFGASFVSEEVALAPGPNLEARARAARYAVLPSDVLTGHTADDQAETVLLNMIRGAGLDGLAGMRPANHPIIRLRRSETEALCESVGLLPINDPTNNDPSILRNRVRNELRPLLDELAGRDVAAVIARQTDQLRADADLLDRLASSLDPTNAIEIANVPQPLAGRAIRKWLRQHIDHEAHPPGAASVERVLSVARGEVTACEVEGGLRIARTSQRLRIE